MSSISSYLPTLGALLAYGTRTLAQAVQETPKPAPLDHHLSAPPDPKSELSTAPVLPPNTSLRSVSITLNNGTGLNIDRFAKLITPSNKPATSLSLHTVEINNSASAKTTGPDHGLHTAGLMPVWLENQGLIAGKRGAGVTFNGDKSDVVINAGLIAGGNGVALEMGGGDDVLIVRGGGRFDGTIDGGSGTNQVILDDTKGGHFNGANQMQHLWVGAGTWTLTGAVDSNQQGEVYSGATLINQSRIGGSMKVDAGGTYRGGTVGNLRVAGHLQLDPATQTQTRIKNDLHLEKQSTLGFTVGTGQAHRTLKVDNAANLGGGTLNIQVQNESDELLTRQLRIVNAKALEGQFGTVTSNLKTLTPELTYTPTGVFVGFKRKDPALA